MTILVRWWLLFLLSFSAVAEVPQGLYVLIPPDKPIPESVLNSDNVTGIVLRANWQDLYVSDQELKLDYLKQQLDRIAAAGKSASLVVNNGGLNTPDAVMAKVTNKLSLIDQNRFHATYQQQVSIPLFWDDTLLEQKIQLLKLLAKEFARHPSLKLLSIQCANTTTDDWNIPPNLKWGDTRFDEDKLFFACKTLIDQAATLFPTTALRMAIGPIHPPMMEDRYDMAKRIYHYATQTYPGRFYIQRHNLSTQTPAPADTRRLMGWQLIYDARPYSGAQFLWPVADTDSCRANGQKKPCDSLKMLADIQRIVDGYKLHYLEIYAADAVKFADSSELQQLAHSFDPAGTLTTSRVAVSPANSESDTSGTLNAGNPIIGVAAASNAPPPAAKKMKMPARRETTGSALDSLAENDSWGPWVNNPETQVLPGKVEHYTFHSELLNADVGYTLYLPETDPDDPLPVIYWLHGKGGNESRGAYITSFLDEAIQKHVIRPTAMVMINGGLHSFYSNSYDGTHPVEDMIINELLPTVEARHPISSSADKRMLEGFSMGGFGALKLAAKYPQLFSSVQTYGAALLSQEYMPFQQDGAAYRNVFNSNKDYFVQNTPEYWLAKNTEQIRNRHLAIRMLVGSQDGTRRYNQAANQQLDSLKIDHEFAQLEGVVHAPRMYYQSDPMGSFAFHEKAMEQRLGSP